MNVPLLIEESVQTRIGAFAWIDVIVSAIVLLGFILYEGKRIGMDRVWISIIGTFTVGVSLGLPLFLLQRELHLEEQHLKCSS